MFDCPCPLVDDPNGPASQLPLILRLCKTKQKEHKADNIQKKGTLLDYWPIAVWSAVQ
jgi:hypothetical protein